MSFFILNILFDLILSFGKLTKIKFLPHEFAQLTETIIVGDKVALVVFTENPYAFLIEDAVVADGYRKQFEILWKLARR